MTAQLRDITFTSRDGLRLHGRHYRKVFDDGVTRRPVLCLAGLTRNGRDFHEIALALSQTPDAPRDVYTLDSRGRGLSQWDSEAKNYSVTVETLDALDFMTVAGIHGAAIIGTSRGGLLTMAMAAAQPTALGPVVLNDIGPVIEHTGLSRIAAYVGRMPLPGTWSDAAIMVRDLFKRSFPAVADEEWEDIARQLLNEQNGKPAPGYDPQIAAALSVLDGPLPQLWPQFEALKRVPVLVLRGEVSDLLSAETVEEMHRRHPAFQSFVVKGQGHAPLLRDGASIETVRRFFDAADARLAAPAPRAAVG